MATAYKRCSQRYERRSELRKKKYVLYPTSYDGVLDPRDETEPKLTRRMVAVPSEDEQDQQCVQHGLRDHHAEDGAMSSALAQAWGLPSGASMFTAQQAPAVTVEGCDGLVLLPGILSYEAQLAIARRALVEHAEQPNVSNLDALPELEAAGVPPALFASSVQGDETAARLVEMRSWVTLGHMYDWTLRKYKADFHPIPREVAALTEVLAQCGARYHADAADADAAPPGSPFVAEAGIINYYGLRSVMGGHVDDAEQALEQPVVSLSTGCDAIFLMGGTTRDDAPTPIRLRSGDVLIQGGASRRCFHGICRIVEETAPEAQLVQVAERYAARDADPLWMAVAQYLCTHRVNLNTRQVLAAT